VLDDQTEIEINDAPSSEYNEKYVVYVSGKILMVNGDPIAPEKDVGAGATIR